MQFEYDPERLIDEVKKRPGIWDHDCAEYRLKHTRQKLWQEIVKELSQNNGSLSKSEMRELELQLQKKWKSIRDCFQKYIANPNRTKRPYIYVKRLQFLLRDDAPPAANSSESEDEARPRMRWKKTLKLKTSTSDDESQYVQYDDMTYSDGEAAAAAVGGDQGTPAKVSKAGAEQFTFASVDVLGKGEDADSERLFLLSLLPHLRSVPDERRLHVKVELMQVLQNANTNAARHHKIL